VNRCNNRNAHTLESVQQHLTLAAQPFGLCGCSHRHELLDVGARDEHVRLPADQHRTFDGCVSLQAVV
jgi:hypothetical protein